MDKITVGVASMPNREKQLEKTIKSIYNYCDMIYVYLNNYDYIPQYLIDRKIVVFRGDNTLGDAGKFFMVTEGYYFSIDDDIIYPPDYIEYCIEKIELYKRKCIVGFHGITLKNNIRGNIIDEQNGYLFNKREVEHFKCGLSDDKYVHILGTGTTAFHTDTIKFDYRDCIIRNMADIWLGLKAQIQSIPMVCLARSNNYLIPQLTETSIYEESNTDHLDIIKKYKWELIKDK